MDRSWGSSSNVTGTLANLSDSDIDSRSLSRLQSISLIFVPVKSAGYLSQRYYQGRVHSMSVHDNSPGVRRSLRVALRKDLEFERQRYQGRFYWVAKDPVALKYYRFEEEEYALLRMLDGLTSPDQIKARFDERFSPQKIKIPELLQFIGTLHRSSLLLSERPGQGGELVKRHRENQKRQLQSSFTNLLAIRLKGFDPDGLLTWLNRYTAWFFTWPVALLMILLGVSALAIVSSQFEVLSQRLPSFHEFFAAENWIWLALVMGVTKVLHELGHGLACKRFGGQCHEMGVMFLVLTPCLYCNVSDTWMLPSKWSRALIAAAGMYVELILAALATYVWWFSQPGLVNQLALNFVVVTSVSTLLFNGNPLLRYDGYYILSDLIEIPNLRQKSSAVLQRMVGRVCMGLDSRPDPFLPAKRKWFFIGYSIAAVLYRWFITFSIFWFLYQLLEPYGVGIVGQVIALLAIWGLLGQPLLRLQKYFSIPGRWNTVDPIRVSISALVAFVILGAVLLVPVPHYVHCVFHVQPRNATNVFVDVPGVLTQVVAKPNQQVDSGDTLVCLADDRLAQQIEYLRGKVRVKRAAYNAAKFVSQRDYTMLEELDSAKSELTAAEIDLKQRELDKPRLTVRASVAGILLEPAPVKRPKGQANELVGWAGSPLEQRNVGAYLDQKTLVGKIVPDPKDLEAVLAIDQGDIEFVRCDQPVSMVVKQLPGESIEGRTTTHAPIRMKQVPKALSSRFGGPLISEVNESGQDRPQSTNYLVSVPFKSEQLAILDGATGYAKIRTGTQTVGQRLWRLACQTFRFEL